MVSIPDKINALLAQRGLLKRDLARALGVSPQTTTDICKGRSAITVPHLRTLIRFFGLRADFWLDAERETPTEADEVIPHLSDKIHRLTRAGLLHTPDPAETFERMRTFVIENREAFVARFGDLQPEERRLFGLPASGHGSVGRIQDSENEAD